MIEPSLRVISEHPDYQILKRISTSLPDREATDPKQFIATIIDLETMGLNSKEHEIIELGLLSFSFSTTDGIIAVVDSYNELHDPGKPIPPEVTKVTGITNDDVRGKSIDWDYVANRLRSSHLIICHNCGFDRNFLEQQTPEHISSIIKNLAFGCTLRDIDWKERGVESSKLDYINWKLGYFYDGHRALNDCWATLNVLIKSEGAFDELKSNVRKRETILCAVNASFDKKDLLKERGYRWSDGADQLPKSWWICLPNELVDDEKKWLDELIYGVPGKSDSLPQAELTARKRYSQRAYQLEG